MKRSNFRLDGGGIGVQLSLPMLGVLLDIQMENSGWAIGSRIHGRDQSWDANMRVTDIAVKSLVKNP